MSAALVIAGAFVLGVAIPWFGIRMLVPSLEATPATVNYRGRRVFMGLGIVWLIWAGTAIVGGIGASALLGNDGSVLVILALAGMLALVCFALGVVDDAYGSADARGFAGHLRALTGGRITTGALKLLGISAAGLVVGLVMMGAATWGSAGTAPGIATVALGVVAGAAIALTSNFVNLTDLRPGRALKVYSILAICAIVSAGLGLPWLSAAAPEGLGGAGSRALDVIALSLFLFGPVLATWRYDLGERGMLGDAGANPMGAVAGMLIVIGLPAWGLLVFAALVLALNLASERVSFSRLIDATPILRWLDMIGRRSAEESSAGET